jgi:putative transposase
MPRGRRYFPAGMIFHTLNRGNNRQTLFHTPGDYNAFIRVVKESLLLVPIRILAYCVMPNHWHFLFWPATDDALSDFMHQMTSTHVRRWHKAHQSDGKGHVYQGRFKAFPVEGDDHYYRVCRYAERNAARAGLVERAEDWVCGSAWAYLHPDDERALPLCDWPVPRPSLWLAHVNQPLTPAEIAAVRKSVARGCPYGRDEWVKQTAKALNLEYTLGARGRRRSTSPGK